MLPSHEQAPRFPSPILSSLDGLSPWAPSGLDYLSQKQHVCLSGSL